MDVQPEVHKTFRDMAKRKLNVIVTGLPEASCSDLDEMKAADTLSFTHLCEEHLSVKPVIAHRGCVRLGRPDGRRPRRLLVHLTSESSVLAAAKQLRRSDDAYISEKVFINPDLSPAEAKLAFEQRQRRRTSKAARRSQPQPQPAPQHSSTPADSSVVANYASQSATGRLSVHVADVSHDTSVHNDNVDARATDVTAKTCTNTGIVVEQPFPKQQTAFD